ncbi:MAG: hypothetical protein RLZZ461_276 [Planctomycetota bacterium]|jgi:hypothetical protein
MTTGPGSAESREPDVATHSAADCVRRCPWCGADAPVVHVHGHGQCAACGTNREPCCQPD